MGKFVIDGREGQTALYVGADAPAGIRRVAATLCRDIALVTGREPEQSDDLSRVKAANVIIAGICDESAVMRRLEEQGAVDLQKIRGRRECYLLKTVEAPFPDEPQIKKALLIVGSDKRGAIYGMFHISEECGVSPLVFWGDVAPLPRKQVVLTLDEWISREPSVQYRGFFINDEWPAFGKWCSQRYGGVNAAAYENIFELLLRLKGNYLWPAMWRSSFWEDGPGLESARLADEYGVIIGTSHHEPLGRAGVEWLRQYKQYGEDNTWSFVTNSDAITDFWRDGLKRCRNFESVITIGMRGEDDSLLMSEDTSIEENIRVIKKAIHAQNQLISEEYHKPAGEVPRMIAIYKEVEDFFYGDGHCEGLREFDEMEDAIWLLSDDNYGHLRSLMQSGDRPHRGGYGMYYHFDYHGAPYSYEWLGNVNLVETWEQMTMAYEYGVRSMWIVNVGDIKGNEYPLSYFMNLAYDYDTWGVSNKNSVGEFTEQWIGRQFAGVDASGREKLHRVLDSYMRLTSMRLPESLNENVYRCEFHENERVWEEIQSVEKTAASLHEELPPSAIPAYESMIYYPAMASLNILAMNLAAGRNVELAGRGVLAANREAACMEERIRLDRFYVGQFHAMLDGKWNHMMDSAHTGFRNWDDNDWLYPRAQTVYPIPGGKIVVSFRGNGAYHLGAHWQDKAPLCNEEMLRPDCSQILLDIDSRGSEDFHYTVRCRAPWLFVSSTEGTSCLEKQPRTTIALTCDKTCLEGEQTASIRIDIEFAGGDKTWSEVEVRAAGQRTALCGKNIFMENEGVLSIDAAHYSRKVDTGEGGWQVIPRLGRTSDALKAFPVTKNWEGEKERPYVEYSFLAKREGDYLLRFYLAPRNPLVKGGTMQGAFCINEGELRRFDAVNSGYFAEWQNTQWSSGVTSHIRLIEQNVKLKKDVNTLRFYAADPNIILEKIVLYRTDLPLRETYLAPPESYNSCGNF